MDCATHLDLAGGALGLSRILARAHENEVDWTKLAQTAGTLPRGGDALRRIGALLETLELKIPAQLPQYAGGNRGRPIPLDTLRGSGGDGPMLERWRVTLNVSPEAIREEVRR